MTNPPELIDTKELARRLKVSEATIKNHRKEKVLPFIMIGSSVRFDWGDVLVKIKNDTNQLDCSSPFPVVIQICEAA